VWKAKELIDMLLNTHFKLHISFGKRTKKIYFALKFKKKKIIIKKS